MTDGNAAAGWRGFLHLLAEEIDATEGVAARDTLLQGVGERMALSHPLPEAADVGGVEAEINGVLSQWGWGSIRLKLEEAERALFIHHADLPSIGSVGDPPGTWLSAVLEGLYGAWLGGLPDADLSLAARRQHISPELVVLRYGLDPDRQPAEIADSTVPGVKICGSTSGVRFPAG